MFEQNVRILFEHCANSFKGVAYILAQQKTNIMQEYMKYDIETKAGYIIYSFTVYTLNSLTSYTLTPN